MLGNQGAEIQPNSDAKVQKRLEEGDCQQQGGVVEAERKALESRARSPSQRGGRKPATAQRARVAQGGGVGRVERWKR